jgi:glutaredoxin
MTVTVELFTSGGCPRCDKAVRVLQRVSESIGKDQLNLRQVDVVEEIDYAVALGLVSVPAIAIDGRLAFTSLPAEKTLRDALIQRFSTGSSKSGHLVDRASIVK